MAGARSATHTFNAMRAIDHREPGLAAYVLDKRSLFAEIICDGIHVDPLMVRLYFKAKDRDRIILVTDGMSATGMPDGTYMLGDMEVEVRDGRCTSDGTLAGSVLTLDRGVQNLMEFTGAALNCGRCGFAQPVAADGNRRTMGNHRTLAAKPTLQCFRPRQKSSRPSWQDVPRAARRQGASTNHVSQCRSRRAQVE